MNDNPVVYVPVVPTVVVVDDEFGGGGNVAGDIIGDGIGVVVCSTGGDKEIKFDE
ncbi:27662_t:CDS:2, partial [Dentiscutata erythropus]